jgi:threonine synthase
MDIQVASNFERLLFYILDENDQKVSKLMNDLSLKGSFNLDKEVVKKIKKDFEAVRINDEDTQKIIKNIDDKHQFILDPHTATGFGAANKVKGLKNVVVLGTAHPYKFNDTIEKITGKSLKAPKHLKMYIDKKEKFDIIGNSNLEVKNYILSKLL